MSVELDSSRWTSVDLALLVLRIDIGISFMFVYGGEKPSVSPSGG